MGMEESGNRMILYSHGSFPLQHHGCHVFFHSTSIPVLGPPSSCSWVPCPSSQRYPPIPPAWDSSDKTTKPQSHRSAEMWYVVIWVTGSFTGMRLLPRTDYINCCSCGTWSTYGAQPKGPIKEAASRHKSLFDVRKQPWWSSRCFNTTANERRTLLLHLASSVLYLSF